MDAGRAFVQTPFTPKCASPSGGRVGHAEGAGKASMLPLTLRALHSGVFTTLSSTKKVFLRFCY